MRSTARARSLIIAAKVFGAIGFVGCTTISDGPVTEAETASGAPTPTETEERSELVELGDGYLTVEIPQSWDTEFEDLTAALETDETAPEFNGRPAQRAAMTNRDETVHVDVFTNVPWPDVVAIDAKEVELIHAERLDIGYEPSEEGYGMWLRVVIVENPETTEQQQTQGIYHERFEDEQYMLVVAPYLAKADLGPPDELGGGMTAFRFPFSEDPSGAWWEENITVAAGSIRQDDAEDLTGAEDLHALRKVVETHEFQELYEVVRSFRVHVDAETPQP